MNGFGKRLNESFNNYFKKLNESKFEEFENMEKEPMFTFPNGEYLYVNVDKDKDTIYAGGATNNGIFREFEIDYDFDDTLDGNLNRLYDTIIEERPELMDEEPVDESLNESYYIRNVDDIKKYLEKIVNYKDSWGGTAIDPDFTTIDTINGKKCYCIFLNGEEDDAIIEYVIPAFEDKFKGEVEIEYVPASEIKNQCNVAQQTIDGNGGLLRADIDDAEYVCISIKNQNESFKEALSFNPKEMQKVIKELEHNFNAEFMFEHDRGEGYSGLVFDISNVKDKQGFKNFIKDYYKIIKTKKPNVIMLVDKQPLPWEKNESLNESLGATDLVRDLSSKFNEIDFIDERDLGENVGLIYDISKLKDKDAFKEYVKEYKVKRSVNNPNKIMIIAREDEGEDIDESYNRLNEKLPHKMISTLSPKDDGKDYENAIGHKISPKYVKHIKEVDRKRLADVYVLVSYEGDEITIPYLEYNKRVYGEPLQYFIAEIPDYDVTNPEEAHRRGYNRNKSFGYRLEKDDIRDDKSKLDSRRSERGHHFTTEHGKRMNQLNRDLTLSNIDSNNQRVNRYGLKSRLKDKYNK